MAEITRCVVLTDEEREATAWVAKLCDEITGEFSEYCETDILELILEDVEWDGNKRIVKSTIRL